jgi:hypothetical protein
MSATVSLSRPTLPSVQAQDLGPEDFFRDPDAWHRRGLAYENAGELKLAAHCYYLACDMPAGSRASRAALGRLGYHQLA